MAKNLIGLEPRRFEAYAAAISAADGVVSDLSDEVSSLVWTDYSAPDKLATILEQNPQLEWVQLPFAGVDAFSDIIASNSQIIFTSAKRSYSEPVAEHALMLCMALGRKIPERVKAVSWGKKYADSLFDEDLLIVGGGGIAQQLVELLAPFRTRVSVIRKRPEAEFDNSPYSKVLGFESLGDSIASAKFVVLACALTPETRFLFDRQMFEKMRSDAFLINVARGEVVQQEDLIDALQSGQLAGCATDVTYPEPLPDDHPMWKVENLLITPHTADTMPIVTRLFAQRLRENVSRRIKGLEFVGVVDPKLGY